MGNRTYSRIDIAKAHVFGHAAGRTLCGMPHGYRKPNKGLLGLGDMLERHRAIAERRGGPNPYKWCCKRCEARMREMVCD